VYHLVSRRRNGAFRMAPALSQTTQLTSRLRTTRFRLFTAATVATIAITVATIDAFASPLDLSVDHTPKSQLTLAPYLFGYNSPGLETTQLYFIYGISDRVDLALAPGIQFQASPTLKPSPYIQSFYLRYFFIPELAIVAHGNWQPSQYASLGVDLHMIKYWSHWSLSINAWWHPNYDYEAGLTPGNASIYIAPEYYFTPLFALFLEVDPSITWNAQVAGDELHRVQTVHSLANVSIVPGLWFGLPTVRKQSFSLGFSTTFEANGLNALSAGLWYAVAFNQPPPAP
jgi:hypothetical protein